MYGAAATKHTAAFQCPLSLQSTQIFWVSAAAVGALVTTTGISPAQAAVLDARAAENPVLGAADNPVPARRARNSRRVRNGKPGLQWTTYGYNLPHNANIPEAEWKADIDWFDHHYVAGSGVAHDDPRVAPLHAADLTGLSPALVVTAGFDPLRDEGRAYARALTAAGVPVDHREYGSLVHAFINFFPLGGDSELAVVDLTSALRAHLSR